MTMKMTMAIPRRLLNTSQEKWSKADKKRYSEKEYTPKQVDEYNLEQVEIKKQNIIDKKKKAIDKKKKALMLIDEQSIRPIRAKDQKMLDKLEAEAIKIRSELVRLESQD